MDGQEVKICNTCKKELPIRFFHKQSKEGRKYTHRGKCSICYSEYRREKGWEKARYQRKKNELVVGGVVDVMDDKSHLSPLSQSVK